MAASLAAQRSGHVSSGSGEQEQGHQAEVLLALVLIELVLEIGEASRGVPGLKC